jgi:hypothetical protein
MAGGLGHGILERILANLDEPKDGERRHDRRECISPDGEDRQE